MEFLKYFLPSFFIGHKLINYDDNLSAVFPNVPPQPGMPCQGEDSKYTLNIKLVYWLFASKYKK